MPKHKKSKKRKPTLGMPSKIHIIQNTEKSQQENNMVLPEVNDSLYAYPIILIRKDILKSVVLAVLAALILLGLKMYW